MADFKEVWVFSLAQNSWTEVYYSNGPDLANAARFPVFFLDTRLFMLHSEARLEKIRISDVANLRSTALVNIGRNGRYSGSDGPDVTNTAAVITLNSTAVPATRQLWMRGLPDSYVMRSTTNATDQVPGPFMTAINLWTAALQGYNYTVRSLSRVAVPPVSPNNYTAITSALQIPGGKTQLSLAPSSYVPITPGRVIISQMSPKLFPGLNGHWDTDYINATTIQIRYNMAQAGPLSVTKGRLRPEQYAYGVINASSSGFNFYRSRRTGKSFLGGRGRRTSVHLRSL